MSHPIGAFDVKQAMNRLANAFSRPRDAAGTLAEFENVLVRSQLHITPEELSEAVTRFIAKTEKSYGFPTPAAIKNEVLAHRAPTGYTEPETDPAEPGVARQAWEAAGIDLDELKRLHSASRGRRSAPKPSPR